MPFRGWRVPRSLAFAHALQESAFITTATSRTGAKGLMQLMPDTRDLVNRRILKETPDAASVVGIWQTRPIISNWARPIWKCWAAWGSPAGCCPR